MAAAGPGSVPFVTMAVLQPRTTSRNPLGAFFSTHTVLGTVHLLTDVLVGAVSFCVVLTMKLLAFCLLPVALLGVPVWIATGHVVHWFSTFEQGRFGLTVGAHIPLQPLPEHEGMFRTARTMLTSAALWRQIGYHLLLLPWGVLTFTCTLAAWSLPLALAALPTYYYALPQGSADLWLLEIGDPYLATAVGLAGLALLLLVTPRVVHGLAAADTALARSLLASQGTGQLVERVGELEESRRRTVDAAEAERRRIERDLHDGAQQRLVALAMTLGRAKSRLGTQTGETPDDRTRELVEEAHREALQAITELRDLTRGLHPPVLSDRGLDAALSALAARSPVPVAVEVDVGLRPSPTVEAMAYFVVSEALANVAKHSGARRASVVVRRIDGILRVTVRDDGMGGADARAGSGLAGITDRIAGVDGRLHLDSPVGGPTILTVELPCAS
jgi:signal transduction histidine kinase